DAGALVFAFCSRRTERSERVRSAGGRSAVPSPDGIPPRLRATPFLRKGLRRCSARLSSPFQGKGDRGGWLLRVAKAPLRFENERSERADARDALRAGGARTIQISRSDTAECVHRQACISHELRKTFPAERHSLGVRGRGIDRRKRREIGAEPCRELQLLRVVARGTDPCVMRQRPLAQLA